ncbi:MAG: hypothetical protein JW873_04860 [Candidatus Saganbacteria bacterium]|nr:hypothetical protein [Candidatus Saganbacteria bacterium]
MTSCVGRYRLGRQAHVERALLGFEHGTETSAPSFQVVQELCAGFRAKEKSVLVRTDISLVPVEMQELIDRAGLSADLAGFCRALVFCSHLYNRQNGSVVRGFVVDGVLEGADWAENHPFAFSLIDHSVLKWRHMDEPRQMIYLNCYNEREGPLGPRQLVSNLAYFLGYLKAEPELRLDPANPGRHEIKDLFAEQYRAAHLSATGTPVPVHLC